MMLAAKLFYERNPELCVMLEFLDLEWIDLISQVASNHFFSFGHNAKAQLTPEQVQPA
ncbi:hypothetical protein [Salinisphaera sp. S4-8]|uniref:hypothetical protein n=1 Tax=Salinisphaera sp. S4-8 TaxID=633357 RepID=UPI00333F732B